MKIFVTGGAGYIGSHTVQKLLEAGFEVVVYDNITTGFREAIPLSAVFVFGDVRDKTLLSQVIKQHQIGAVIHFAAKLNVAESIRLPLDYYENNTDHQRNAADDIQPILGEPIVLRQQVQEHVYLQVTINMKDGIA